jgi:glucosamine--fructose-6-phosphate aminotransferase (isomerizing)
VCGIFGVIKKQEAVLENKVLDLLGKRSIRRGSDSSGLLIGNHEIVSLYKSEAPLSELLESIEISDVFNFAIGFSRMKTNSENEDQPALYGDVIVLHNGIVVNSEDIWSELNLAKSSNLDSTVIAAIFSELGKTNLALEDIANQALQMIDGQAACAILIPKIGKLILFSNNGSLYYSKQGKVEYFASERFTLQKIGCIKIENVRKPLILNIQGSNLLEISEITLAKPESKDKFLIDFVKNHNQEKVLSFEVPNLKRCSKCILPISMPFISFDEDSVCNYCNNYKLKFQKISSESDGLLREIERFPKTSQDPLLVPFSGGRDSTFTLHKLVTDAKVPVVAFTYDWGFVTDIARRNISRVVSRLGVEHILVSADIRQKRANVKKNLAAWLKHPDLGLLSLLTAGDKFFFKFANIVYDEVGARGQCWGINPLEETHFKAGFLGIKPTFESSKVYKSGLGAQAEYQSKRFLRMTRNPAYFNKSIFDTLEGEWHRSFASKPNYIHFFDFYKWEESEVESVLDEYRWERAADTRSSWRIGDATAPFYNYVYYTVAGFSEHDTFRSNQIREGMISREEALALVEEENQPRYLNLRWYLDAVGIEFESAIKRINKIPKLY